MEHLLDGQVALRLLAAWSGVGTETEPRTAPKQSWDVVLRHRGRTRGRLRAVLLETASDTLLAVPELPGLAGATDAALAAVGWSQAHEVLHRHGLPSWDTSLTPACAAPPALDPLLPPADEPALRTWMLLVVLAGASTSSTTGPHRGVAHPPRLGLGRLLKDGLPARPAQGGDGYGRIQAHLSLHGDRLGRPDPPSGGGGAQRGKEVRAAVAPTGTPRWSCPPA